MVEPQPSKLIMWVRSPSPAPIFPAWRVRFEALGVVKPDCIDLAHIAQVVEHSLGKGEVTGSSPVMGTTFEVLSDC